MKKTPLFDSHKSLSAKFIPFAGWSMPFSYGNPSQEHLRVRQTGGLFDVSHMGQIRVKGKNSLSFLEKLLPTQISSLKKGESIYTALCLETGGMIDDLIVYCISQEEYFLCVNSAFKDKDFQWMQFQNDFSHVSLQDESEAWGMIAVQGDSSFDLCEKIFPDVNFKEISKFQFKKSHIQNSKEVFLARTGYTGEEGFELYIPIEKTLFVWEKLLNEGKAFGVGPIGLGARDTLRLEMAYLLSGQDFDENKTLLQAGLHWILTNQKNHIGKSALMKQKEKGIFASLKAFLLEEGSAVPRKGHLLYDTEGKQVGVITSGAKSPSLNRMIALGYREGSAQELFMEARNSKFKANVVKKPFYKKLSR